MNRFDINDYDEYVNAQIERGKHKFTKTNQTIERFTDLFKIFIATTGYIPKECVCMGMRSDGEYRAMLKIKELEASTITGVDIVPDVVSRGKNCYCYDFNKLPEEWSNKFDFITSNSVDHAFDVAETLKEWHRVCAPSGYLLLTFSSIDKVTKSDIYSFSLHDIDTMIDNSLFEIIKVWDNSYDSFNVILKKR